MARIPQLPKQLQDPTVLGQVTLVHTTKKGAYHLPCCITTRSATGWFAGDAHAGVSCVPACSTPVSSTSGEGALAQKPSGTACTIPCLCLGARAWRLPSNHWQGTCYPGSLCSGASLDRCMASGFARSKRSLFCCASITLPRGQQPSCLVAVSLDVDGTARTRQPAWQSRLEQRASAAVAAWVPSSLKGRYKLPL